MSGRNAIANGQITRSLARPSASAYCMRTACSSRIARRSVGSHGSCGTGRQSGANRPPVFTCRRNASGSALTIRSIALRAAVANSGSPCAATQRAPNDTASSSPAENIIGGSMKPGRSW